MALTLHFLRPTEPIDLPMQVTTSSRKTRAERRAEAGAHEPRSRLLTLGDIYAPIDEDLSEL